MKKEKSTRRKEQGEATKKKLYQTAQRLFIEYGVDNVSVDNIVREVGVARGTFYVHFESKDALISALISDYTDKADIDYETFFKDLPPETTSSEQLLAIAGKVCDVIEHTIGYETIRVLYKIQLTCISHAKEASSYNRVLYPMLAAVLENGKLRGEFQTSLPHDVLAQHMVLAMRGLTYEWCIRYPDFDLNKQSLEHFKILLDGIKAK